MEAARDKGVLESLATKVSNERITKELDLMFAGRDPHHAAQILYELNIMQHSLKVPPVCEGIRAANLRVELKNEEVRQQKAFASLKAIQAMHYLWETLKKDPMALGMHITFEDKDKSKGKGKDNLYYLAMLLPYVGYKYMLKGKSVNVYEYVMSDGLKVSRTCLASTR